MYKCNTIALIFCNQKTPLIGIHDVAKSFFVCSRNSGTKPAKPSPNVAPNNQVIFSWWADSAETELKNKNGVLKAYAVGYIPVLIPFAFSPKLDRDHLNPCQSGIL